MFYHLTRAVNLCTGPCTELKDAMSKGPETVYIHSTTLELITRDLLKRAIEMEAQAQLWPGGEV